MMTSFTPHITLWLKYDFEQIRCIELCCEKCKEEGKQAECVHMLHLVPVWQSEERHRKLKIMMQDRPGMFFLNSFVQCLQIV